MKETLIRLLSSTLKAAAISTVFGAVAYLTGINVIMTFTISFILQFIVSYLYGSYLELKAAKYLKEEQLKELEILSRITFAINCAACKQPNQVVINANTDNVFECQHCKAKNSAYITAEAALVTIPIETTR
jgi:hypothetical protein